MINAISAYEGTDKTKTPVHTEYLEAVEELLEVMIKEKMSQGICGILLHPIPEETKQTVIAYVEMSMPTIDDKTYNLDGEEKNWWWVYGLIFNSDIWRILRKDLINLGYTVTEHSAHSLDISWDK